VKKRYHKPLTPCDRLIADARVNAARDRIVKLRADLDPVRLLAEIRSAQPALVALADTADEAWSTASRSKQLVPLDSFVAGLRTAWQDGEVRPTSQSKPRAKRCRRPDPLASVTDDLRSWFEADPSLSGRQLLDRLQNATPSEDLACRAGACTGLRPEPRCLRSRRTGRHSGCAVVPPT
jgi:hypothetical protein